MPPTPPTPRPRWQALLLSAVRVWLAVGLILWLGQEVVIFPGLWLHRLHDVRGAPWAEVLEVERPGGSTFPLLFADGGHDRLVLLFHGNGETADRMAPYARVLQGMGWNFAAMEYRGYAGASGWPTEAHLSADVAGTIEALRSRGQVPARTVVHGRSIGGGVAGTYLDHARPAGLVLESSFDSLEATARDRWLGVAYPLSWLLRQRFRTDERLQRRPVPVLQVHDTSDTVVGVARARRLSRLVGSPLVLTEGLPHGAPLVLQDARARAAWTAWLEEAVPAR